MRRRGELGQIDLSRVDFGLGKIGVDGDHASELWGHVVADIDARPPRDRMIFGTSTHAIAAFDAIEPLPDQAVRTRPGANLIVATIASTTKSKRTSSQRTITFADGPTVRDLHALLALRALRVSDSF